MENEYIPPEYATYNGLNRPAMIMGVPLLLLLAVGFFAVFGGYAAIYIYGVKGFSVPVIAGFCLFAVRTACENDPNALEVIKLNLKGKRLQLLHGENIIGYDSTGNKF